MSIRVESNGFVDVENGATQMEDVSVYVTSRADVAELDYSRFVMGSVLYVIREGEAYVLDDDGSNGVWRSMRDGSVLTVGGETV
jgi:hypothetical protein